MDGGLRPPEEEETENAIKSGGRDGEPLGRGKNTEEERKRNENVHKKTPTCALRRRMR